MYPRLLQNVLLPVHNAVRRRKFVTYRRFLEKSQWWSRDELLQFQWQELQGLLRLAFTSVPYYRRKYAGIEPGDIRNWDDFAKLPPLTREEVNANRDELFVAGLPKTALLPHATGGSSGVPVRFYMTLDSYDWRTAATRRAYSWSGYELGDKCLFLWGAPVGRQPRWSQWKSALNDAFYGQLIVPTFTRSDEVWERAYRVALRRRPRFILGYTSSLVRFGQFLERDGRRIQGIRSVLNAAEPLGLQTRTFLEHVFQAQVFDTYGSREFMSIAAECPEGNGLHVSAENLVVETAVPSGESESELLVTDLHNQGTVFIRYAIADLGIIASRQCSCGRGLPVLQSVVGRKTDVLRLSDGRSLTGLFFHHLLKDIPEVEEFQVRQNSPDCITVSCVLSAPLCDRSRALFEQEMKRAASGTRVELKQVAEIPRGRSGKLRTVIGLEDGAADPAFHAC